MRFSQSVDRHCPDCHGNGNLMETTVHEGEYWTTFVTCPCVQYDMDDEMKALLRAAISRVAQANP